MTCAPYMQQCLCKWIQKNSTKRSRKKKNILCLLWNMKTIRLSCKKKNLLATMWNRLQKMF